MRFSLSAMAVLGALAGFLVTEPAAAHEHVEVDLALGYRILGGVDATIEGTDASNHVSFDGSVVWGPIVGYRVRKDAFIYVNYTRQETTARLTPDGFATSTASGGLGIDSFQFGGNVEKTYGRFVPYLGLSVGVVRLSALRRSARDEWNFSAAFDGGLKIDLARWVHLRFLARLPLSFYGSQSSTLCLESANCLVRLDGQPSLQAELLGGLGVSFF